jgi:hypothetical protein
MTNTELRMAAQRAIDEIKAEADLALDALLQAELTEAFNDIRTESGSTSGYFFAGAGPQFGNPSSHYFVAAY